jgi:hypothetical protein
LKWRNSTRPVQVVKFGEFSELADKRAVEGGRTPR